MPGVNTSKTRGWSRRYTIPVFISFLCVIITYVHLRTDLISITRPRYIIRKLNDVKNMYTPKIYSFVNEVPKKVDYRNGISRSYRLGCREYPKGGQSCVISGISCMEVQKEKTKKDGTPVIYLVDDTRVDGAVVESDIWCQKRSYSADPRYFGPREWPSHEYFAPRQSCLRAKWRTGKSLFSQRKLKVKWLDEFALVSLDYVSNNHNNHYLKDIIWLLDVVLWQRSISVPGTLPQERRIPELFSPPKFIVFPQSLKNFTQQTSRDVNRLNLAIILGMDPSALYSGQKRDVRNHRMYTKQFLAAFPAAKKRLIFYGDERENSSTDLICTKKLIVGSKLGDMGHERVCTHLRRESWKLYNLKRPANVASGGWLRYHRPPRRVILLQRHISRRVRNVKELTDALQKLSEEYDFEFEYHTTAELNTAEEHVKFFSRIGVLVTPHGSQAMGGMWMPRYGAIIELFPPGYSDYAFDLLCRACNLWHYGIQGKIPDSLKEKYRKECGKKMHTLYDQCVQMKCEAVQVPIAETIRTVLHALKRLGHDLIIEGSEGDDEDSGATIVESD